MRCRTRMLSEDKQTGEATDLHILKLWRILQQIGNCNC